MKNEIKTKRFFSAMAYFAIGFLAVAMLISFIASKLGSDGTDVFSMIANVIKQVAQALAYTCACISAFSFVRSKRNPVWTIIYIVACVMIAVFVILPLFGVNI